MNKTNQFKVLVEHELARLESIITKNETASVYPVAYRQYAKTPSQSTLRMRQPSKYNLGFFSLVRTLGFMSLL